MDKELEKLFVEFRSNRETLYKMIQEQQSQSILLNVRKHIEESISTEILLRLKMKESDLNIPFISETKSSVSLTETQDKPKEIIKNPEISNVDDFIPDIDIRNVTMSKNSSIKQKSIWGYNE